MDADTRAFNGIISAFALPKSNEAEKKLRHEAIQQATRAAIEVPYQVMESAFASMEVIRAMAAEGNPNSVSDAGVGALCARAAVLGAFLNVRINAAGYNDKGFVDDILARGAAIVEKTIAVEKDIMAIVSEKIGG